LVQASLALLRFSSVGDDSITQIEELVTLPNGFDNAVDGADNRGPMECTLAVVADAANREVGGKLNVLGVFDQIYGKKFPMVTPQFYVVVRLTANPAEFGRKKEFEIVLLDPDGKPVKAPLKGKAKVPAPQDAGRASIEIILQMVNVPFAKPGSYAISVLVSGEEKASIPLEALKLARKRDGK
jgi:hypothetical protein